MSVKGVLQGFLWVVVTSVLCVVGVIVLLIPVWLWRTLVRLCAKWRQPNLASMLRGWDPTYVAGASEAETTYLNPLLSIPILLTLDGRLDLDLFKDTLRALLDKKSSHGVRIYAKLGQRVRIWCGYAFYETIPGFRVEDIIQVVENSSEDSEESPMTFLNNHLRDSFHGSALWSIHIQFQDKRTLVLLRFNHLLGDGLSFLNLLQEIGIDSPYSRILQTTYEGTIYEKPGGRRSWFEMIQSYLLLPRILNKHARIRKIKNPFESNPVGLATGQLQTFHATTNQIPLEQVKKVKNVLKTTVTAVLGLGIARAVEELLKSRCKGNDIPEDFYVATTIPFPRDGNDKLTNQSSAGFFQLPIWKSSLQEKVGLLNGETNGIMLRPYARMLQTFVNGVTVLPLKWFQHIFFRHAVLPLPLILSNIPGPTKSGLFGGCRIEDIILWLPVTVPGICLAAFSYNGNIRIGVKGDTGIFQNQEEIQAFVENIETGLELMMISDIADSKYNKLDSSVVVQIEGI